MIIRHLQQCLKTKRKTPCPQEILSILNSLHSDHSSQQITLTQKGVFIEILSRVFLMEHQIFASCLGEFRNNLYGGRFDPMQKTIRKKAKNQDRQVTTTTRKKKKGAIEVPRTEMNLDQLLQRELSSPNNTEQRSQVSQTFSKVGQPLEFIPIERLQESFNRSQDFVTPIKQIETQKQNKLDEYREIINVTSKNQTKMRKKQKNEQTGVARTRKKLSTQPLPEQINTNISLQMLSQISIKKEVEQILEVTKKKKNKDKENLYHHEAFKQQISQGHEIILENRETIAKFNKEFTEKQSKGKVGIQNQFSGYESLFADIENTGRQTFGKGIDFQSKKEQLNKLVEQELLTSRKVQFSKFTKNRQMSSSDKSLLFYSMLCCCNTYKMEQKGIEVFGEITIRLI